MPDQELSYLFLRLRENAKAFSVLIDNFDNWYDFLLFRFGAIDSVTLESSNRRSNLKTLHIDRRKSLIEISYKHKYVNFYFSSERQLENNLRNIYQTYIDEQYGTLFVKNKTVVDIGANNGDSAIYFAMNGASMVYAYEPYPYAFSLAKRNVHSNRLNKKIELRNEAVTGKKGTMKIDENYESINNSMLQSSKIGKKINVVDLDYIVEKYKLRNAVLKVDCEGSEYEIFSGAKESSIKSFSQIAIEYHFGYEILVKRLRKLGFKVRYTEPAIGRNSETNGLRMDYGMIYAQR